MLPGVTDHVTDHVTSQYESIDPAPGLVPGAGTSLVRLGALYQDRTRSIFERYQALFALRNLGGDAALDVIASGLEDESALFRHEAAFVLGQIGNPRAQAPLPHFKPARKHPLTLEPSRKVRNQTKDTAFIAPPTARQTISICLLSV
eukprot:1171495-Rhodomonas_salina.3